VPKRYWEIAPTGHEETQLPHSIQASALIFAFPPSMAMASTGQVPTHASQETQVLSATTAFAMKIPLLFAGYYRNLRATKVLSAKIQVKVYYIMKCHYIL
jgi:hypothetical protein